MKLIVRPGYSMKVFCLLLLLICGNTTGAAQASYPLEAPDTSSPSATLNTFLNEMNKAVDMLTRPAIETKP
jgi:hypothetical protein